MDLITWSSNNSSSVIVIVLRTSRQSQTRRRRRLISSSNIVYSYRPHFIASHHSHHGLWLNSQSAAHHDDCRHLPLGRTDIPSEPDEQAPRRGFVGIVVRSDHLGHRCLPSTAVDPPRHLLLLNVCSTAALRLCR